MRIGAFPAKTEQIDWCKQISELLERSMESYRGSADEMQTLVENNGVTLSRASHVIQQAPMEIAALIEAMTTSQAQMVDKMTHFHERIHELETQITKVTLESRVDPLTHVFNRLAFEKDMCDYLADRAQSLHLAVIDLDNFKDVNDSYGHPIGDKVLRFVGTILKKSTASAVYRYGGEEFVMIYNDHTWEEVTNDLEKLLEKTRKSHLIIGNDQIQITFSGGVTLLHPEDNADMVIKRADDAMYRAKSLGKNRIFALN